MGDGNQEETDTSRRNFLKNTGYVAGGVVGGGIIGSLLGVNFTGTEDETSTSDKKPPEFQNALMYFNNQQEFRTLADATERIYPEDDNGPGAIELGVPFFIDHQLAGSYGHNIREYMQGPFHKGTPYQGYQTRLKRHEIFMKGIRELEKQSNDLYDASFTDLDNDKKDEILSKFENDDIDMKGVKPSEFFNLLLSATLAGVYADPLYGGNANMEGWKMKEFPGDQMQYIDDIEKEKFIKMEPRALNSHIDIRR
ncbi:MAG TPA: gluconate 2-dehydrogenase subunit 3 family protein [Bacillota bacterium]|nr:gluconate 2-dehydrogenase subunit 3 family protein [Bacillota bacterium]